MPVAMANHKSIGYMPYSLRPQMVNPGDAESAKKIAAWAQRWATVRAQPSEGIIDNG